MTKDAAMRAAIYVVGILLCLAAAASAKAQDDSSSRDLAIVGVHVVPMDEARVLEDQTVLVTDGVVRAVGDAATTTVPAGFRRVAGNGRFLMPGLADLHIHLRHEEELVNYLAWGVTTVMHLGGSGETGRRQLEFRRQIDAGALLGPNIYTTDRVLDGDPALPRDAYSLTNGADARRAVRDLRENGFDFVKIYNNVSQSVFEDIVDEADRQGLAVIGHIPRGFDPLLALGGGQDAVAHTEELFFTYFRGPRSTEDMRRDYAPDLDRLPQLIEVLAGNDVALMPDLSFTFTNLLMWDGLDAVWGDPEFAFLRPQTASLWQRGNINRRARIANFIVREQWKYDLMRTLTLEFQRSGILQVIGTDASLPGLYPGKAVHRELTELVKAGISTFDALAIGTKNAGEFIRRYIDADARSGQVLPGYRADFVLLRENPLLDVRHARGIDAVAVGGRYIERQIIDTQRAALRERYTVLFAANDHVDAALAADEAGAVLEALVERHAADAEMLDTIENRINAAGYAAAFADHLDAAREILELNTALFPGSANTWDSLAEIVLYMGDRERALALYRRALEVDPAFSNAAENIEKILRDRKR